MQYHTLLLHMYVRVTVFQCPHGRNLFLVLSCLLVLQVNLVPSVQFPDFQNTKTITVVGLRSYHTHICIFVCVRVFWKLTVGDLMSILWLIKWQSTQR